MARLIVHHLSGSKAGSDEIIPLPRYVSDIKLGREVGCEIRFDPNDDGAVSRHHAAIRWQQSDNPGDSATAFTLVDLMSSNGTYLNGRRLEAPATIKNGDVIELGRGGPSIRITIELAMNERFAAPATASIAKVLPPAGKSG